MRTLSARILLGFIALTITFGVFATTIVFNLREIAEQASLTLNVYVQLALASSDLEQREDDLKAYLDQGILEANRPSDVVRTITSWRTKRDAALNEIKKAVAADSR